MQGGSHRLLLLRHAHGIFDLTENLRLAQHHAVEPAGYAEGVAHGRFGLVAVEIGFQRAVGNLVVVGQPAHNIVRLAHAIEFGAVAGGQNHGFFSRAAAHQLTQCFRQRGGSKSQPLAYAQRSGLVIQADGGKLHGGLSQKPKLRYYSQTAPDGE